MSAMKLADIRDSKQDIDEMQKGGADSMIATNISWDPVTPKRGKTLVVVALSRFLEVMKKCFGETPITLGREDLPILTGMAAAWSDNKRDNPFETIIEKIEEHGAINIWAEY